MTTFDRVAKWNDECGKSAPERDDPERKSILLKQLERIQEELDETVLAVMKGDDVEALDGGCDLDVTVSGFNYMLNMDYSGAINAVLDNNDDKIYDSGDHAIAFHRAVELSESTGEEHRVDVTVSGDVDVNGLDLQDLLDMDAKFSVHRVRDNKVCKPNGFVGVDLTPFVN